MKVPNGKKFPNKRLKNSKVALPLLLGLSWLALLCITFLLIKLLAYADTEVKMNIIQIYLFAAMITNQMRVFITSSKLEFPLRLACQSTTYNDFSKNLLKQVKLSSYFRQLARLWCSI